MKYPGGKRKKGQHKAKGRVASGKKAAAKLKKVGRPKQNRRSPHREERGSQIVGEERSKQRNKDRQAGKGIFKPVTLSAALSKITGITGKATRGAVTKAVWAYIKSRAGHFSVFSACSDSPGFWSNRTASRACTVRPSSMVVARVRGV